MNNMTEKQKRKSAKSYAGEVGMTEEHAYKYLFGEKPAKKSLRLRLNSKFRRLPR